jgi:hypothetical protein
MNVLYEGDIEKELSEKGSFASVTKGVSMLPLFKTERDMVIIAPLDREPKKYDIVLYRGAGGEYILHRVIAVKPDLYIIRGDNTYSKEYVPKDRVIGILVSFNRKGKRGSAHSRGFKIYSRVWNFIYPLRLAYVKARRLASGVYRRLFKD